jgi:hypothetical protein
MDKDMEQQLNAWRETLRAEVLHAEAHLESLRKEIQDKRQKLGALDQLLAGDVPTPEPLGPPTSDAVVDGAGPEDDRADDRDFTPVQAYWVPILETLVEFGGSAHRLKVIDRVGERMKPMLKPADYEHLPNSFIVRWRNRVPWQVSNMKDLELIRKDAGRGIWEITPKGRKWLDDNR